MVNENYKDAALTGKVIGCAMQVHKFSGNGFPSAAKGLPTARQEVIYQRSVEIEMKSQGLKFSREFVMPIEDKGTPVGKRRVDFFVETKLWSN